MLGLGRKKGLVSELAGIVGESNVQDDRESMLCYAYDASIHRALPWAVVFPRTVKEVAEVVRLAGSLRVPMIPRGAGTGLSGGSVPHPGGIVLALTRMNSVRELCPEERKAVVEPGVITADLHRVAQEARLFYPPDPGSQNVSTIGGNVAEGAGGPRGFKYGVTRDYVVELETVLPGGEIVRLKPEALPCGRGFDLAGLMVGSEGTLGVITEITVRLIPRPRARGTLLATFESVEQAAEATNKVVGTGILPSMIELMDELTVECVERYGEFGFVPGETALLVEVDGCQAAVQRQLGMAARLCLEAGALRVNQAASNEEAELLWAGRRAVPAALSRVQPTKISEDATVPRSKLPEMVRRLKDIGERHDVPIAVFGHAGDGNLHPNLLVNKRDPEFMARAEKAISELFDAAIELGGTLSGEHGIGSVKAPFLRKALGPECWSLMEALKRTIDPQGILNPGKIFAGKALT